MEHESGRGDPQTLQLVSEVRDSCGLFANLTEANSKVREQGEFRSPGVTTVLTEEVGRLQC